MRRPLLEQKRYSVQRIEAMTVRPTRLQGRTQILGVGEVSFDVEFPVKFVEVPILSFGGELDKTSVVTATTFPTISVCVIEWENEEARLGDDGLFVGATLAVVTGGNPGQSIWVHWTFDGKALRNPVDSIEGVDDVL
jgi:hypothetical protein